MVATYRKRCVIFATKATATATKAATVTNMSLNLNVSHEIPWGGGIAPFEFPPYVAFCKIFGTETRTTTGFINLLKRVL